MWKQRKFLMNFHLKEGLREGFTACQGKLMPEEALISFTLFDAQRSFAADAK